MDLKTAGSTGAKLIMVGGKGGVGKTSCASAIALGAAKGGSRVLLISSDPAPSLSDIFECPIGDSETRLAPDCDLYGLEISSEIILKKWKERFGPEIYEVLSSFASVDYDFVDYIGSAPGIEEEFMLYFIVELVQGHAYDLVVWDTAPAGHTLQLLKLPHLFLKHLEAATKFYLNMYSYLEKLKDSVRLKGTKKGLLDIIGGWERLSTGILDFIRDGERTKYIIVTIPEALGVKLTERMIDELHSNGLTVENIIINYVIREADCPFHEARKRMQDRYIELLKSTYGMMNFKELQLFPYEVKGLQSIDEVSRILFE